MNRGPREIIILKRLRRAAPRMAVALLVLVTLSAIAGWIFVQSEWFHNYVRNRIVGELEHATGGRVELAQFSFHGATLTARIAGLILHGKEGPGEAPLLKIESATLGLRIVSALERKIDLASLRIDKPVIRILIYPDGSTNLPLKTDKNWAEELINLAVRHYEIDNGALEYDGRNIPLNLRGDNLSVRLNYDAQMPAYRGTLSTRQLRITPGERAPVEVGLDADFAIEKARIAFSRLRVSTKESRADLTGELDDPRAPHGTFSVKATSAVRELIKLFPIPLAPTGSAAFDGKLSVAFSKPFSFEMSGHVNAREIGYSRDRLHVQNAGIRAEMYLSLDKLALSNAQANAMGAQFTGSAALTRWRQLHIEGTVNGLTVAQAARTVTDRETPWNGTLAGTFTLDTAAAEQNTKAQANLTISPAVQGIPIQGHLEAAYDQSKGELSLGSSSISTPATRLDVAGTLNKTLQVQFRSSDLNEILPALALVDSRAPQGLPLQMNNGIAEASGTVTGDLKNPRFQGQVSITNGSIRGHAFDRFSGSLDASLNSITASQFTLSRGDTEATGSAGVTAREGTFEDASVTGSMSIRNAHLEQLVKEAGGAVAVSGTASATLQIAGSVKQPQAEIVLEVQHPAAFGEQLDQLQANLHLSPDLMEVSGGDAQDGPARLHFSGTYRHPENDWKSGTVEFQGAAQNVAARLVEAIASRAPQFDALLSGNVQARGRVEQNGFELISADGNMSARAVAIGGQPLGELTITAATRGPDLTVRTTGKLLESSFAGQGAWKLEGDEPGTANLRFSRMSVSSVHRLMMLGGGSAQPLEELPFDGFVEGRAAISGLLRQPKEMQAELTLDTVQVNPKSAQVSRLGVQPQDLILKNAQPVVVIVSPREATIRSAEFSGRDTNLAVTGTVPFSTGAADLSVRGSVNLIAVQLFNSALQARGNATVQVSVRGALRDPALNGRMELKNASLYLKDAPSGVDNVNGVVLFDRNRATISKLTAQTGGGTISFGGFVDFGSLLTYRLRAEAQQVRLRWPEDVSTTFNANLALNGTSSASTLSGTLTLNRTTFSPRTDFGQLLAAMGKPAAVSATPNPYLRDVQFDVHVESSPTFELQTSLTRDIETAVDLRLRGSPLHPVLLGTISVNQGEVQVFGNRYTIDRGDIRFLNPVKIEPAFDMDLETKARGVTVNVTFSGTTDKLKVNYSSDPPLRSSEIIALLAVGRDPAGSVGAASAQAASNSANFVEAGGGLLSQAVSAQLSSRLQRFFGASRVKIDPTMTGVDNTPQARLTFEQQVSRDITLTYITNLNYTQEQIVRLEWNLNRNWSAVAVRDSNGLFGIDFQYRKRF